MDRLISAIKKSGKVLEALTELMLKLGTLVAVVKMIYDSVK